MALRDAPRDESDRAAVRLDPHRSDARRSATGGSGAWDGARRDASADAILAELYHRDEDAEKLAARVPDVRGRAARELPPAPWAEPLAGSALCTRDAARSEARSSAAATSPFAQDFPELSALRRLEPEAEPWAQVALPPKRSAPHSAQPVAEPLGSRSDAPRRLEPKKAAQLEPQAMQRSVRKPPEQERSPAERVQPQARAARAALWAWERRLPVCFPPAEVSRPSAGARVLRELEELAACEWHSEHLPAGRYSRGRFWS
jgi:hypothetical protein